MRRVYSYYVAIVKSQCAVAIVAADFYSCYSCIHMYIAADHDIATVAATYLCLPCAA